MLPHAKGGLPAHGGSAAMQPEALQQTSDGIPKTAVFELGMGQHGGPRPTLAPHFDGLDLGPPPDFVPGRVVVARMGNKSIDQEPRLPEG
jgi:hypothetical protein